MSILLTLYTFATSPIAVPLWGAISFFTLKLFEFLKERKKAKQEDKKLNQGDRREDREDFQVITDSLRTELDRLNKSLSEANDETQKCEQRYFELSTQYRELLLYCARLGRTVRNLEQRLQKHVADEPTPDEQRSITNQD